MSTTDAPKSALPQPEPIALDPGDTLPRPTTVDQMIKALMMAAGKHPKNRVLSELRERPDGGALRSGDLRTFAAILNLWASRSITAPFADTATMNVEPRSSAPEGNGHRDPFVGPADVSRMSLPAELLDVPLELVDPRNPAAPDNDEPFLPRCQPIGCDSGYHLPGCPWAERLTEFDLADLDEILDAFVGPGVLDDTPETPTPEAPPAAEGGETPAPKGAPGATPGTFATLPSASGSAPAPRRLGRPDDPFTIARSYVTARSPSQVLSYYECAMKYRIRSVERTSETPAWWNIGGNAFHETIRWWETECAAGTHCTPDMTARKFELAFADETAKVVLANPNISLSEYRAANKGTEGREWWKDHGPTMAADYVSGNIERDAQVLKLGDDALALEVGFTVEIGGVPVRGYLDQALTYPSTGAVVVRDYKTGSRLPDDPLQLQIYAIALRRVFGVTGPIWGAYWRARRNTRRPAGETRPMLIDVDDVEPIVAWRVREMDSAERSGIYPARPSSFCGSCGVRALCPVMGPPETRRMDLLTG